jgi:hypothetical protein
MTKEKMIKKVVELLKEAGFTNQDYVISLQGPTLMLAKSGNDKILNDLILKADLIHLGIDIRSI